MLVRLTLGAPIREIDLAAVMRAPVPTAARVDAGAGASFRASVRARIVATYLEEESNVSRAARRLGISRNAVYRAIQGHGGEREETADRTF